MGVGEIDFDWLLRLRVTVGRCGEMDLARWWNTNKQLGTSGANVLGRGFPRTHLFAQVRSVIAVAQHRCAQLFDPPGCATLWNLTEEIEDAFDSNWESWLDEAARWKPFFEAIARIRSSDLVTTLEQLDLVTREEVDALNQLKCLFDGHAAVLISGELKGIAEPALVLTPSAGTQPENDGLSPQVPSHVPSHRGRATASGDPVNHRANTSSDSTFAQV